MFGGKDQQRRMEVWRLIMGSRQSDDGMTTADLSKSVNGIEALAAMRYRRHSGTVFSKPRIRKEQQSATVPDIGTWGTFVL